MKHFTIIAALLLSVSAHATNPNSPQATGGDANATGGNAVSHAGAHSQAVAGAQAGAASYSSSGAISSQTATTGNQTANPTASVTVASAPANTSATIKTAPDVFIGGPATVTCAAVSGGVSASWMGGGFAVNGTFDGEKCNLRENIRILLMVLPALYGTEAQETRAIVMGMIRELAAKPGKPAQADPSVALRD